ncbi:unnamed protein product [Hermetia illucens]|uniref:Uncharacterized protein n=1 Tax=Hermetia illucens TaxID=343691 RepID=A0A7R8UDR7_HERIL|nr:unnamed protein product [Hermetia illucens]
MSDINYNPAPNPRKDHNQHTNLLELSQRMQNVEISPQIALEKQLQEESYSQEGQDLIDHISNEFSDI